MRLSQKWLVYGYSFVRLCTFLCDPLWFSDLRFTTKIHKGFREGHKGLLRQPYQT